MPACHFCAKPFHALDRNVCAMPCGHGCHMECLMTNSMNSNSNVANLLAKVSSPIALEDGYGYEAIVSFWKHVTEIQSYRFITEIENSKVEDTVKKWSQMIVTCKICGQRGQMFPLLEQLVFCQLTTEKTAHLESRLESWRQKAWAIMDRREEACSTDRKEIDA